MLFTAHLWIAFMVYFDLASNNKSQSFHRSQPTNPLNSQNFVWQQMKSKVSIGKYPKRKFTRFNLGHPLASSFGFFFYEMKGGLIPLWSKWTTLLIAWETWLYKSCSLPLVSSSGMIALGLDRLHMPAGPYNISPVTYLFGIIFHECLLVIFSDISWCT